MQRQAVELLVFTRASGRQPLTEWFDDLRDRVAQASVLQRLDRLQSGNLGDCRSLGRCLILCAGSKRTQKADIERARVWLEEARRHRKL